ncbi:MAG: lysophospholipid acyltransferase family protein [Pseudolabrys sp.]
MLRVPIVLAVFFSSLPFMIALQWSLSRAWPSRWGAASVAYYRFLCRLLRIRVRVRGAPVSGLPVLIVSNHISWADIVVLGAIAPMVFVAKREVSGWPLIGAAARVQKVVFVDRERRQQTGNAVSEIAARLAEGHPVVLFAEGTSSDGNRVLPFRTALIGAASAVRETSGITGLALQPMSISYPGLAGLPMQRAQRPRVAWYGDLDFVPHLKDFIRRNDVDAVVSFGPPIAADSDRKTLARTLETTVRRMTVGVLRGHPPTAETA